MIDIARETPIFVSDFAAQQGVTYQTAKDWIDRGLLEAVKIGGRWKTTAAAINAFARRPRVPQVVNPTSSSSVKPKLSPETLRAQERARQEMLADGLL